MPARGPNRVVTHGVSHSVSRGSDVRLVVIAGQSNAGILGAANTSSEPTFDNAYPAVQFISRVDDTGGLTLAFDEYGPGDLAATVSDNVGLEVKLGRVLDAAQPGQWAIVKFCQYGSALANRWGPDDDYPIADPLGNMFEQLCDTIESAQVSLGATFTDFVWVQGEEDADGVSQAPAYRDNLIAFVAALRVRLPEFTFHYVRLNDANVQTYLAIVRDAQEKYVTDDTLAVMLDVDDLPLSTGPHYDADGLYDIGERAAISILGTATLSSVTVTPDAPSVADTPVQLYCYGTYDNGGRKNLTATASWSSNNEAVATVVGGLVTKVGNGSCTITAQVGALSDGTTLTAVSIANQPVMGTPGASTTTVSGLAWPSHQAGDLLVYAVESATATAIAAPVGMSEMAGSPIVSTTNCRLHLFSKTAAGSSETAPDVAVGASNHAYVAPIRLRGVSSVAAHAESFTTSLGTALVLPAVTPTAGAQRIVHITGWSADNAGPLVSGYLNHNLINITEHHDAGTTLGNGGGITVVSGINVVAADIGTTDATSGASTLICSTTLALAP